MESALNALGVSYIDLYLIHWPGKAGIPESSNVNSDLRTSTWKTLVELKAQGVLRSIGVSNYNINHLKHLLKNCYSVRPVVNQVTQQFHVGLYNKVWAGILAHTVVFTGRMPPSL